MYRTKLKKKNTYWTYVKFKKKNLYRVNLHIFPLVYVPTCGRVMQRKQKHIRNKKKICYKIKKNMKDSKKEKIPALFG